MTQRYRRGIDKQIEAAELEEQAEREQRGSSLRDIAEVMLEEMQRGRRSR